MATAHAGEEETPVRERSTDASPNADGIDTLTVDLPLPVGMSSEDVSERLRKQALKARLFGSRFQIAQIDRFKVIEQLGEGGMGVVYAAYDDQLDRRVAIKLLRTRASSAARTDRFMREAIAMAKLSHPNVVAVYDVGTWEGQPFVAMEFVKGQTLGEWVSERAPDWRAVLEVYCAAARGLAAAHDVGIIHRDFKPDNVLIGDDGQVRVADFGLARAHTEQAEDSGRVANESPEPEFKLGRARASLNYPLTVTGTLMGTPAYMSPEQFAGRPTGPATDQFSLCVALYESLYRQRPFAGQDLAALATQVKSGAIEPAPASDVPAWLHAVIVRGLQPDPDDRWPSMHALIAALTGDPEARRRRRIRQVALVAAVAVVIASLGWLIERARDEAARERVAKAEAQAQRDQEYDRAQKEARRARAEARRARDAARMASAREYRSDPTRVVALLREVEDRDQVRGWSNMAHDALTEVVAERVLAYPQGVRYFVASPDGQRLAMAGGKSPIALWPIAPDARPDGAKPVALAGHTDIVQWLAFNHDGARIASASMDGTVRIWNAHQPGRSIPLAGHSAAVLSVAFDPAGTRVVSASRDRTVRVWGVESATSTVVVQADTTVMVASFSPDGQRVVAGSLDGLVHLARADGIGHQDSLSGHRNNVRQVVYSPDGTRIASASHDHTARVWKSDGSESQVLSGHTGMVYTVAFSPDSRRVVTASSDHTARIWSVASGAQETVLRGHAGQVSHAEFSPDGDRVITASFDKTARIWSPDGSDGSDTPTVLSGHDNVLWQARFSPDGRYAITASGDRSVRIWPSARPVHPGVFGGLYSPRACPSFSPDGRLIAAVANEHRVVLLDASTGLEVRDLGTHEGPAQTLTFNAAGDLLLTASADHTARIWDVQGERESVVLRGHTQLIISATFNRDSTRVLTSAHDGTARLWNAHSGQELDVFRTAANAATGARFHPDGSRIVTWSSSDPVEIRSINAPGQSTRIDILAGRAAFHPTRPLLAISTRSGTISLWNLNGQRQAEIPSDFGLFESEAFSPDGKLLMEGVNSHNVSVWSDDGRTRAHFLSGHEDVILRATFSPDGRRVASASVDGTVRVFPLTDESQPIVLAGHGATVDCVQFSPDSAQVLTVSRTGVIRVWRDLDGIDPVDNRLWRATEYCMSPDERQQLLGIDSDSAAHAQEACQARVHAARNASAR